jgi:hypothetical protein
MFHGTSSAALDAIVAQGFKIGGIKGPEGVPFASAGALFGYGVYVSENPDYAQGYIRDFALSLHHDGVLRLLFAKCVPSADSVRVPATGAFNLIILSASRRFCRSRRFSCHSSSCSLVNILPYIACRRRHICCIFYFQHIHVMCASPHSSIFIRRYCAGTRSQAHGSSFASLRGSSQGAPKLEHVFGTMGTGAVLSCLDDRKSFTSVNCCCAAEKSPTIKRRQQARPPLSEIMVKGQGSLFLIYIIKSRALIIITSGDYKFETATRTQPAAPARIRTETRSTTLPRAPTWTLCPVDCR